MALEGEMSAEFRVLFEAKSMGLFRARRRQASLKSSNILTTKLESLTKLAVKLYAKLSEASLYDDEQFHDCTRKSAKRRLEANGQAREEKKQEQQEQEQQRQRQVDKARYLSWWQLAIRFAVLYLMAKQVISLFLQYNYDFLQVQLNRQRHSTATFSEQERQTSRAHRTFRLDAGNSSLNSSSSSRLSSIELQLATYESALKFIGSPFMHMSFIVECAQMFLLLNVFAFYMVTLFYYRFVGPLNISLFRMLIDAEREQSNLNKLILDEVNKLVESSLYSLVRLVERNHCSPMRPFGASYRFGCGQQRGNQLRVQMPAAMALVGDHKSFIGHLQQLALEGSLQPENRMPNWMTIISWAYATLYSSVLVVGSIALVIIISYGPIMLGRTVESSSMDLMAMLELGALGLANIVMISTWACQLVFVVFDLCYASHKIIQEIENCISRNTINFSESPNEMPAIQAISVASSSPSLASTVAPRKLTTNEGERVFDDNSNGSRIFGAFNRFSRRPSVCPVLNNNLLDIKNSLWEITTRDNNYNINSETNDYSISSYQQRQQLKVNLFVEQLNENLLKIMIHYRIFVRQFEPVRRQLSFVAIFMIYLYVIYPLYAMLHVPYFNWGGRLLLTTVFWAFLLSYDFVSFPICVYHTQCKLLMKSLFRLISHVDAIQTLYSDSQSINFSSHVVALLRRELNQPDLARRKLSIMVLGSPFSYKHWIRIHFWTGLLSLYALSYCGEQIVTNGPTAVPTRSTFLGVLV